MQRIARISTPVPVITASSEKSDNSPFISVALFSGIGLVVCLVAMIAGVQGQWY